MIKEKSLSPYVFELIDLGNKQVEFLFYFFAVYFLVF